jgi:flagellar hook protein FlgE
MYSGITGMKAFKSDLDVIGNNIANINTTGYKTSRASFKEMLSQTLQGASAPTSTKGGSNPTQVGLGVMIGSIDTDLSQGSLQSTGRQTDLAIEGNGFFALGDGSNIYYSRDGILSLDANYNLVAASTGLKVLGWMADPVTGIIDTVASISGGSGIRLPIGGLSLARQTSIVKIGGNLDASAAVGEQDTVKFDIYDSLGLTHDVSVVLTKTANAAEWSCDIYCPDADSVNPIATGTLQFDAHGHSLVSSIPLSITLSAPNGSVTPIDIDVSFADTSQLNGPRTADLTYQDGLPQGTLESFSIDRNGTVSGTFTNGASRTLAQLALAKFNNASGLMKVGNNLLRESPNSGPPQIGEPGTGGLGRIAAGFIEASNVDLANEFASMIVAQRGFQANSRIISVSDEVLQDLVALKR